MKLNPNDLPENIKKLNPHLFVGGVGKPFSQPNLAQALDRSRKAGKAGAVCLVISLIRFGRRSLDSDNLAGGLKPLRDAIAQTLGVDDGAACIRWEYGQVETQGQQGTMVKIESKLTSI